MATQNDDLTLLSVLLRFINYKNSGTVTEFPSTELYGKPRNTYSYAVK